MAIVDVIPEGFQEIPSIPGFAQSLQPLYTRLGDDGLSLGFVAGDQHLNALGLVHGGALMTIADMLCARCIWLKMEESRPLVTVSLDYNFVRAVKLGCWVEVNCLDIALKKTAAFITGEILSEQKTAVTFSGVFMLPDNPKLKVVDEFTQRVLADLKS